MVWPFPWGLLGAPWGLWGGYFPLKRGIVHAYAVARLARTDASTLDPIFSNRGQSLVERQCHAALVAARQLGKRAHVTRRVVIESRPCIDGGMSMGPIPLPVVKEGGMLCVPVNAYSRRGRSP